MDKLEKKDPMNDVDNPFKVFFPQMYDFTFLWKDSERWFVLKYYWCSQKIKNKNHPPQLLFNQKLWLSFGFPKDKYNTLFYVFKKSIKHTNKFCPKHANWTAVLNVHTVHTHSMITERVCVCVCVCVREGVHSMHIEYCCSVGSFGANVFFFFTFVFLNT